MYLKLPDVYPYQPTQLRVENPNASFPSEMADALLAEFGVYPVRPTSRPEYDPATQTLSEALPSYENGAWVQTWAVRDLTAEELQARVPRSITPLQGMRAIKVAGLISGFYAWKNALDPVDDFEAIAFLEKAQTWDYDDPTLNAALEALGVMAQKDALFTLAATL